MFEGLARPPSAPHRVRVFGAPLDGTASFRPGQRFGPAAIRAASDEIETYSPVLDRDLADASFADAGDLELPLGDAAAALERIGEAAEVAFADGAAPFALGGDHAITIALVRAAARRHPRLRLVQLDAHADLRDEWTGTRLSHASVIARAAECVDAARIRQLGVRSGTREEYAWMRAHGTRTGFAHEELAALVDWAGEDPVYLTVDLDVFDPAFLPGTGTPEPGGIDWWAFQRFVKEAAARMRIVGADLVELAPGLDPTGRSAILAAKALRELLLVLA